MRLAITGDDRITELYVDGVLQQQLPNRRPWYRADIVTIPADTRVIAVLGHDLEVSSAMI